MSALDCIVGSDTTTYDEEEDDYGIFSNEMQDLCTTALGEDKFDSATFKGPNPPFIREDSGYKPLFKIRTDYGEIVVNHANLNILRLGYTICLYGARRSGKTKASIELFRFYRPYIPTVYVFTKTIASCEFNKYVPNSHIVEGLDFTLLEEIIEGQVVKKKAMSWGVDVGNIEILLMFEDCMAEGLKFSKLFDALFYNGRHYGITTIVTLQDIKGLTPGLVNNTDICYCFPMGDARATEAIYERYLSFLPHKKMVTQLMYHPAIAQKYHMLVFDTCHRTNPPDERISYGCLTPPDDKHFVMGDAALWKRDRKQLKYICEKYGLEYLLYTDNWDVV